MHRDMGQPSLAESLLPETLGHNERLELIAEAFDWDRFGRLLARVHSAQEGRPSYPPLMMVKVLLLEQWYNLSDPQMEEALQDRISFRRFVGLGLQDDTPDYSTISRFRATLEELGISETLFKELEAQLDERGLVLKEGTLMDATLVKAHVRRPSTAGRGAKSPADPDADWTKTHRGRRTHFGYKVHLGVDAGTGLVRKAALTPAKVYESEVADGLVSGDERAVYGDRAYESKRRRRWLKSQGINDRIMHRSHKHQRELPHWQKRRNELISPRRALVEKVFGTLKRSYGYSRVRYRGLGRNAVEMWFKLMAYNLRRADRIRHGSA
jgi:IS5 family transposase